MNAKRYISAAQVFIAGDQIKEAIDAFIAAQEWTKAKKVAQELEPRSDNHGICIRMNINKFISDMKPTWIQLTKTSLKMKAKLRL